MQRLGENPQWVRELENQLRDDDATAVSDLAESVVYEILRLHQSEYLYRTTTENLHFEGFQIPRGWLIRVAVRESHRDAQVFGNPETFDPTRFHNHTYERSQFAPFGLDHHVCVGAAMASTISRLLVEELARKGPWQVRSDGPPACRRRHWQHWETSPDLRISWRQ